MRLSHARTAFKWPRGRERAREEEEAKLFSQSVVAGATASVRWGWVVVHGLKEASSPLIMFFTC